MYLRLTNGFDRLSDSNLLGHAQFIYSQMEGNPNFLSPVPSLPEFDDKIQALREAYTAAADGGRILIVLRRDCRKKLIDMLHLQSYYVVFTSAGNVTVAMSSGFELARGWSLAASMQNPRAIQVTNSSQPGVLLVKVRRVKGAIAYMYQYTTDPEVKEGTWMNVTCSKCKLAITGLNPGTKYFIRVAAIGNKDQVMYSDVVTKIAA